MVAGFSCFSIISESHALPISLKYVVSQNTGHVESFGTPVTPCLYFRPSTVLPLRKAGQKQKYGGLVMSGKRIAIYPGTFDPITNGHIDILQRACDLFDELIVAIARNPAKEPFFPLEERVAMIQEVIDEGLLPADRVRVEILEGLAVEGASQHGAIALVRGLRAVSDFEYEFQMALMNRHLAPKLHTVYLMPKDGYTYLSSTLIKGVARHGGDIKRFVPPGVERRLFERYGIPKQPS